MTRDQNAFIAGLFIILSLLLGVGILIAIRGTGSLLDPMQNLTVAFSLEDNVGGLQPGDQVRVGGVIQGRIRKIRYIPSDKQHPTPHFHVEFTLPARFDLRNDAVVVVEQGLTGTSHLNITSLGTGQPVDPKTILTGQGGSLSRVLEQAPRIMTRLQTTLDEAQQIVAQIRQQIPSVVQRYDSTLTRVDQAFTEVKDILGDTKTDIRSMLSNLNHTTGTFKSRLPTTFDKTDTFLTRITETIDNARGTLGDIRTAADHLKNATAEARSLLVRNRSKIDHMITSLRNTSTQLESASTEIRRSPWRLLYQPKLNELSNLNLFDATRELAQAANQLNDAASAVRDASQDPTLTADRMQELLRTLEESFQKYTEIEKTLWNGVR